MDCNLPGSSVHGILHTRILEWVAIPFPQGSSQPRDQTRISSLQADSLPSEPLGKPIVLRLDLEAIKKRLLLRLYKLVGQRNLKKYFMRTSRFQKSKPLTFLLCFLANVILHWTTLLLKLESDFPWLHLVTEATLIWIFVAFLNTNVYLKYL